MPPQKTWPMGVQDTLSELMVHVKETAKNDELDVRKLVLVRKAYLRLQELNEASPINRERELMTSNDVLFSLWLPNGGRLGSAIWDFWISKNFRKSPKLNEK